MRTLPALALLLTLNAALAAGTQAERQDLARQRAEIAARFAAESKTCAERFLVNACMDEARARQSAALKPVIAREQQLDLADRRQRAAEQAERVRQRQQEAGSTEAAHRTELFKPAAPAASHPRPEAQPHPAPTPEARQQAIEQKTEAGEREGARNRERLRFREAALRQRQEDAAKSEAQRAGKTKGKKAIALPTPSAAEIEQLKASAPAPAASR
jgi:hypothetical protein